MRFFSAGTVAELSGLPRPSLQTLVREGAVRPAIPSERPGVQAKYSTSQLLAIALGRWLRHKKGWALRPASNVTQALLAIPDAALERCLSEGRDHLLVVNGNCMPRLVSKDAILSDEVLSMKREANAANIELRIDCVDVGTAWADLLSKIDRRNRKAVPR